MMGSWAFLGRSLAPLARPVRTSVHDSLLRQLSLATAVHPAEAYRFVPGPVFLPPSLLCVSSYKSHNSLKRTFATTAKAETADEEAAEEEESGGGKPGERKPPAEEDPMDRTRVIPWQVSAQYMKSEAYRKTYGDDPVWKPYRRQHKGMFPRKKTRKTCIRQGKIWTGSPCPICRDEYLVLDYRNTDLLKQFISPYTGEILSYKVTNICQRKHARMEVEMAKAKYFGTLAFKVPFRHYDYKDFYGPTVGEKDETPEK